MKKFNLLIVIIFGTVFLFSANNFAQDKKENCCNDSSKCKPGNMDHAMMKECKMNMMCDSTHQKMHSKMNCTDTANCEKMRTNMDHKTMDHSMMTDSTVHNMTKEKDSIVREGVIDLEAIDKNNDGKVFQDMMDYNVISDKAGKCPLCGMKLKEVSLKEAKDALIKSGYKVK